MGPRSLKLLPSLVLVLLLVLVAQAQTPQRLRWPFSGPPRSPDAATSIAPPRAGRGEAPARSGRDVVHVLECDGPIHVTWTAEFTQPPDSPTMTFRQAVTGTAGFDHGMEDFEVDLLLSPAGAVTYTVLLADASGQPVFETVPLHIRRPPAAEPRSGGLLRTIVLQTLPGVAQTLVPTATAMIQLAIDDPGFGTTLGYALDGPADWPTLTAELSNGLPATLPGPHAVLGLGICTRTADVAEPAELRVVQQILRSTGPAPVGPVPHLLQEFTVPITSTVVWAEVPLLWQPAPVSPGPVLVSLRRGAGIEPEIPSPATATASLIRQDPYSTQQPTPQWMASGAFPLPAVLHPGVVYTLEVKVPGQDFLAGVDEAQSGGALPGRLFFRFAETQPWLEIPSADLSFRLIGVEGANGPPDPPVCETAEILRVRGSTATAALPFGAGARAVQVIPTATAQPIGSATFLMGGPPRATTRTMEIVGLRDGAPQFTETYPLRSVTLTPLDDDDDGDGYLRITPSTPLVIRGATPTADVAGVAILFDDPEGTSTFHVMYTPGPSTETSHPLLRETPAGTWESPLAVTVTAVGSICGMSDVDGDDGSDLAICAQLLRVTDPAPGVPVPDPSSPTAEDGFLQVFVSPVTATADWFEFALAGSATLEPLEVTIHDLQGIPLPPPFLPPPMAAMDIGPRAVTFTAQWGATNRVPSPQPLLHAGRPYAIRARTFHQWWLGIAAVTVTACDGCQLFTQADPSAPWVPDPTRNLSFRWIGAPVVPATDVADGPPISAGFALALGPNPSRGAVALSWSGGRGRVRIEVTDVAGRVVRRVRDAGLAAGGRWVWDGRDDRGRESPAGVYFTRVSSEDGALAARRVVRVR